MNAIVFDKPVPIRAICYVVNYKFKFSDSKLSCFAFIISLAWEIKRKFWEFMIC